MGRARISLAAIALGAGLATAPSPAAAGPHPLFNDRGTLNWYTSLAEAQAVARETGRLIFIESGRLECPTCRNLVSGILPSEPIRSRISRIAIGFADDCDRPDPTVCSILSINLPNAPMLPLVGFVTPELRWVTGWSGGTTAGAVMQHLSVAEERYQRCQQVVAARRAALANRDAAPPSVAPAPAPVPATPPAREVARPAPTPPPSRETARATPVPAAPPAAPAVPLRSAAAAPKVVSKPVPPEPKGLAVAPSAPAAPNAEALLGTPDARETDVGASQPSPASGSVSTDSLLDRARAAAADQAWGQVIRLGDAAADQPPCRDTREIETLVKRAQDWVLDSLASARDAAAEHRYDDALRTLAILRREIDGTCCPAAVDAERGQRAVERLRTIELGSPDRADAPDSDRRIAYAEFRGTRWAPLFRHGS